MNTLNGVSLGAYDGTPVAWSLTDTTANKEITVASTNVTESGIAVTNLQDGAAMAWAVGGTQIAAISYDTSGTPDPVFIGANTPLTDGGLGGIYADNTVSDIDIAMTGGLGFTAAWESTDVTGDDSGDTTIHLRTATTNGVGAAPGLAGGEIAIVESAGLGVAADPVIQGYEIVNIDNDSLEVGFHVGFVMNGGVFDTTADNYGTLTLARYEIPVYELDAAGALVLDGLGRPVPAIPVDFGLGAETAPISIGRDGLRGTADDGVGIVLTDQGLFDANSVPVGATVLQGRDISIGSLHDGQLVVSYINSSENVQLKVFVPTVDETGDRETLGDGSPTDVIAIGHTTYSELTLPANLTANLGSIANPGQTQYIVPQQNGSFGVFWAAAGVGGVAIQGIIYQGAGTNWSPSPVITFATRLPANVSFQIAPTGVDGGGLEDGFFVSWESAGAGIQGQRFDMEGTAVGTQIAVGDPGIGNAGRARHRRHRRRPHAGRL